MKAILEFSRPLLIGFALLAIYAPILFAADDGEAAKAPELSQFDFWVGEWDLTWPDSGRGTNIITKDYDGYVITEHFDGAPSMEFQGMSVSVFNSKIGKWQQTWVDNQGGYLDFVGGFKDGVMDLRRVAVENGDSVTYRMLWHNITADSLDWIWQKSHDSGVQWQDLWPIHYVRRR